MISKSVDFIRNITSAEKKSSKSELGLKSVPPVIAENTDVSTVLSTNIVRSFRQSDDSRYADDGLYVSSKKPLKRKVIKPVASSEKTTIKDKVKKPVSGKLLEVAIRDILVHSGYDCEESSLQISSASVWFKDKSICHENYPFNRKLYKFLIRNSADSIYFSVKIEGQDGSTVSVPLPFPKHNVRNKKLEVDFAITDHTGKIYSGLMICTVSVSSRESEPKIESLSHHYTPSNDPNNPQRGISLVRWKSEADLQSKKYFLLMDKALVLPGPQMTVKRKDKKEIAKLLDIAVLEHNFSLMNLPIMNCFQPENQQVVRQPVTTTGAQHTKSKQVLTVTVLRGIEVPVREESALVQPVVEVEWCNIVHSTSVADGPAPVWQQTIQFKVSRLTGEQYVKLRLFDQHPIWGLQWLGETVIPLECLNYYQEVEKWIGLSSLRSPKHLFGYVQASPGYSYTRLYVLMKMHQVGVMGAVDEESLEALSKAIQKCISIPYKIDELENPQEIAKLVTLLAPLPSHYGPLKPQQALNLNKVDHYGRAALLTTLFHGLGIQAYVLLGTSQTSKLAAYCLTTDPSQNTYLWDPESGEYYDLNDSRCSLLTVFRLIDPKTVWDNTQKSMAPSTLKYNPDSNRDWQPLSVSSATSADNQSVQILHLHTDNANVEQENREVQEMEQQLKDYLVQWRDAIELSTTFNQHAEAILRSSLMKENHLSAKFQFDKKKLRQLYRSFYIHGFIMNLRDIKLDELLSLLLSTKSHMVTGPVEFALICHIQSYIGKIRSIWLGLLVLRSRE